MIAKKSSEFFFLLILAVNVSRFGVLRLHRLNELAHFVQSPEIRSVKVRFWIVPKGSFTLDAESAEDYVKGL